MQLKLPALTKLAKASPEANEIRSCNTDSEPHSRFRHIIYPVLVQPEAMWLIVAVHQMNNILSLSSMTDRLLQFFGRVIGSHDVVGELGEDSRLFVLSQWTHI